LVGIKKTPVVIGTLFWKPFDVRFQGLLEKLKAHREQLQDEITICSYREAHNAERLAAEERRTAAVKIEAAITAAENAQKASVEQSRVQEERYKGMIS
jgi:hypothetical protein